MNKKIAIIQSNYIPWKGYFDLINSVDEFIILDEAQYTKRDWRNRNKIKTSRGSRWLTIPVNVSGKYLQRIDEVTIANGIDWQKKHFKSIVHNYTNARYFELYKDTLNDVYLEAGRLSKLSSINRIFIEYFCSLLGITTRISSSADYSPQGTSTDRLVSLCRQSGARVYISGPAAKDYLDETLFTSLGIAVTWWDYSGYPEYAQLYPPFDHHVSIIDLIMNEGPRATQYMKSFH